MQAISEDLKKLFHPEGRDTRAHYYHNVTGSFRGDWVFDEEMASRINKELPRLRPAPKAEDDASKNRTAVGDDGGTNSTTTTLNPEVGTNTTKEEGADEKPKDAMEENKPPEGGTSSTKEEGTDEKPKDTIEENYPTYLEDIEKFRGSFQFNESGTFVFNLKETKATEHVNWVKVRYYMA